MKKITLMIWILCISIVSKAQTWDEMTTAPTGAFQIEADHNGDVYILGPTTSSNIYRKKANESSFTLLPGGGVVNDIAVYAGKMYGLGGLNVQNNSNIYVNSGSGWGLFLSPRGILTDVDYNGTKLFGCNVNKNLYDATVGVSANFTLLSGTATKAVGTEDGTRIVCNDTISAIFRTSKWDTIAKNIKMVSISAASLGNVWAVDVDGNVYQYDNNTTSWKKKNGANFKSISVDKDNHYVWTLSNDGKVYRTTLIDLVDRYTSWQDLGSAPNATTQIEVSENGDLFFIAEVVNGKGNIYQKKTSDQIISFYPGNGIAKDLAAYGNKLLVIGTDNTIYQSVNSSAWAQYSPVKYLTNIDMNAGILVGNESNTATFKHDFIPANSWLSIGTGIVISSIGTDSTLVGVNGVSSYRYNYQSAQWDRLSNNISIGRISVGGKDNIWGLTSLGFIYYYNNLTGSWEKKLGLTSGIKAISLHENTAIYAVGNDNRIYKAILNNITTGLEDTAIKSTAYACYPNPVSSVLYFDGNGTLFSTIGQKIMQGENTLDLTNLPEGMYLLQLKSGTHKVIKK